MWTLACLALALGFPNQTPAPRADNPRLVLARQVLGEAADAAAAVAKLIDSAELLNAIAIVQERAGDVVGLEAMLRRVEGRSAGRDPGQDATEGSRPYAALVRNGLAVAKLRIGDESAILQAIAAPGCIGQSQLIGDLVVARACAGDDAGALKAAAMQEGLEDRLVSVCAVAVVRMRRGDARGARELLQTNASVAEAIAAVDPDGVVLNTQVIEELCKGVADQAGASEVYAATENGTVKTIHGLEKPWDCVYLAGLKAAAGDHAGARTSVERIRKAFESGLGPSGKDVRALLRAGARDEALLAAPAIPGAEERSAAFCAIATAQARAGDPAGAARTSGSIKARGYLAMAVAETAAAHARQGDKAAAAASLQEAVALASGTREVEIRALALCAIAGAHRALGDDAAARAAMRDAAERVRKMRNELYRDSRMLQLVHWTVRLGYLDDARALAELMAGWNASEKHTAARDVAKALAQSGDRIAANAALQSTLALALAEKDPLLRDEALMFATRTLARFGDAQAALAAARAVPDPLGRGYALLGTAQGLLALALPNPYLDDAEPEK